MELEILSLFIALGTAIGLVIETLYLAKLKKQSESNQYNETLRKSMDDLYQAYRTDFTIKTKEECELLAIRILDILAILAHLKKKKKISDELLEFVSFDFQIAKGIMEWFDKEKLAEQYGESTSEKIWTNLKWYFDEKDINPCKENVLPGCIKKYNDLI